MVGPEAFRLAMSQVATPVVVVTVLSQEGPHGTTVGAFTSISLEPPMISIALDRQSDLLAKLRGAQHFGVNVLASDQTALATTFSKKGLDKFASTEWRLDAGLPRLPGCALWLVCRTAELLEGGDHLVVLGIAEHAEVDRRSPLVYHDRAFSTVGSIDPDVSVGGSLVRGEPS
ncbi:flavin reductase family protein [Mycobacterium sp. URHB0044]|jgi:flavin reductase (DIM6/NTAB) family NADH-FMN oxidoreductase RutF|uniref:flavin reductase family protein n=1 Tax=Mycobacterium sp. URHB0044 TaxID=1380386 RepID=UPI0009DEBFE3|nr:flavin reductase family protein [Mycobacterium sp. URHB0044]